MAAVPAAWLTPDRHTTVPPYRRTTVPPYRPTALPPSASPVRPPPERLAPRAHREPGADRPEHVGRLPRQHEEEETQGDEDPCEGEEDRAPGVAGEGPEREHGAVAPLAPGATR